MILKPKIIAAIALAGAAAIVTMTIAFAQTSRTQTSAPSEQTQADKANETGVITPRRSEVVARRQKAAATAGVSEGEAPPKMEGEIDWGEVRRAVDDMKTQDAVFQRQVRAMELSRALTVQEREKMRPKGLMAVSPRAMKSVSESEVRETRVPVLAPVLAETMGTMKVAGRRNSFTAFGPLEGGAYFEVIGTRMRIVGGTPETMKMRAAARPAAMKRLAALNAPYTISRHEQGVDLSFSRFNVAYQISVLCPDPDADARCASDDFVMSLADNLALLNAEEGEGK
jgi:hypothetical protein